MIIKTLKFIEEQIGLKLELCDYFTGVQVSGEKKYFNVILNDRTSESQDYVKLVKLSKKRNNNLSVEPNGLKRVAIYF